MYLNKKQNILKRKAFNLIFVPLITVVFTVVNYFIPSFTQLDKTILLWLSIGISAFICQYIINFKLKTKHTSLQYLFIILSINISLFIGFTLERYVITSLNWWKIWIIDPFIVFIVLFIIKEIIWWYISFTYAKRINNDKSTKNNLEEKKELELQVQILQKQIKAYEEKLNIDNTVNESDDIDKQSKSK